MKILPLLRSQSSVVVAETVLVAVLMFATYSLLVRVTDMRTVGLWVLVNSLLGFSRLADFWTAGLSSFVGEARGKGDPAGAAGFVSTAVLTGALGYLLLATAAGPILYAFAGRLAGPEQTQTLRAILPLMPSPSGCPGVGGAYQLGFLGFGRPLLKAVQTVCGAAVFLVGALMLAPHYGLWGILVSQAIQAIVMLLYAVAVFHAQIARTAHTQLWNPDRFRALAAFGMKATVVGGLQLGIEPTIRLLVSQFGGLAAVPVVDVASRLVMALRSVITSLGQLLVPSFARSAATAADGPDGVPAGLYGDVSRLFVPLSVSGFSLLLSLGPLIEEVILGRRGTGLVAFLWILSGAWFTSTVTSPAYFLLVGRRQLRPLFWGVAIMTGGAGVCGVVGGGLGGVAGALVGVGVAITASSIYIVYAANALHRPGRHALQIVTADPGMLVPLAAPVAVALLMQASGLAREGEMHRLSGYALGVAATFAACIAFGGLRGIPELASRVRA